VLLVIKWKKQTMPTEYNYQRECDDIDEINAEETASCIKTTNNHQKKVLGRMTHSKETDDTCNVQEANSSQTLNNTNGEEE